VGANVGSYTVLAAKAVGCSCISVEPMEGTVRRLRDNLALNGIAERVTVHVCAVGEDVGVARMTALAETVARVVEEDAGTDVVEVPRRPLDSIVGARVPSVLKMDVEGYEGAALKGAQQLLSSPDLRACIVETLTSVDQSGSRADEVATLLASHGFSAAAYDPDRRTLERRSDVNRGGNTLFLRDWQWVRARVEGARRFAVAGRLV
jgi:FkbM family methyltransferase